MGLHFGVLGVSLVAALATLGLAAASFRKDPSNPRVIWLQTYFDMTERSFGWLGATRGTLVARHGRVVENVEAASPMKIDFGGFLFARRVHQNTQAVEHALIVPLWQPLVLFAAYPIVCVLRGPIYRRSRFYRRKRGLCVKCGYDLTGNLSGVCPECGNRIRPVDTPTVK